MWGIRFRDDEHKNRFEVLCNRVNNRDVYITTALYLFSLDEDCYNNVDSLFDFKHLYIKLEGLHGGWHTGTSRRTVRLAFNLWNGYCYEDDTYTDEKGIKHQLPSSEYTPDNLFCCNLAPYYFEAIKLRYPEYTKGDNLCDN